MQYRAKEKGRPFWPGGKVARAKSDSYAIMRIIRFMGEFCRFFEKNHGALILLTQFSRSRKGVRARYFAEGDL